MTENWTVNRLSDETGMDRRTIKKILKDVAPVDKDGAFEYYKLADFIGALTASRSKSDGDLESEKTRLTCVQADIAEVERARLRNEVIETSVVFGVWENIAVSIRRTIITSRLSDAEKDSICNELKNLKIQDFLEQRDFDQGTPAEIS